MKRTCGSKLTRAAVVASAISSSLPSPSVRHRQSINPTRSCNFVAANACHLMLGALFVVWLCHVVGLRVRVLLLSNIGGSDVAASGRNVVVCPSCRRLSFSFVVVMSLFTVVVLSYVSMQFEIVISRFKKEEIKITHSGVVYGAAMAIDGPSWWQYVDVAKRKGQCDV
jgi:hypothetical protein